MITRPRSYAVVLATLAGAGLLLYFAVPRGLAAFAALDGDAIAHAVSTGKPQGADDLRRLAVSRAAALTWGENAAYANELAVAYRLLGRVAAPETRKGLRNAAYDLSVAEIRARPLNAYAWWRLGVLRAAIDGGSTARSAAFQVQSVRAQPHAMKLIPLRLRAICDNWLRLDAAQRRDMRPQFVLAWNRDRKSVLRIAENPWRRAVIAAALATAPETLQAFETALKK